MVCSCSGGAEAAAANTAEHGDMGRHPLDKPRNFKRAFRDF
jgi:hypothetical protein